MQDVDQALTAHEYDEWGRPENVNDLDYIKSYSPFSNIGDIDSQRLSLHPKIFVSLSLQDHNVAPWETLGWVNKIRKFRSSGGCNNSKNEINENDNNRDEGNMPFKSHPYGDVLFRIISDAGHSGPQTLDDQYAERALEIAFLQYVISFDSAVNK